MPQYHLLSVDLDGTLLTTDKRLTPCTLSTVQRCTQAGVAVVICTARPPRSARPFYDELRLDTELIAYNGAMVTHPPTDAVVSHRAMPPALAAELLRTVLEVDDEAVITFEKADQWYTDPRGAEIITDTAAAGFVPDVVCDLWECVAGPVTKMLVSKSPETLRQIESALEEQLPTQVSVTKTDDYLLQIAVAGVSKSAALEDILRRRGLTRDDLVAIGDAPNDVDMLQFAALGIAVDNAPSEVKAAAQVVAPSNDEDGVAVAIEEHVL